MIGITERATPSGSMFGKLIFGSFIVGVLGSISFAPRIIRLNAEAKVKDATWMAKKLAFGCGNAQLDDIDPWGRPYRFHWRADGVVVQSLGDDGISNTADDIWSNR